MAAELADVIEQLVYERAEIHMRCVRLADALNTKKSINWQPDYKEASEAQLEILKQYVAILKVRITMLEDQLLIS